MRWVCGVEWCGMDPGAGFQARAEAFAWGMGKEESRDRGGGVEGLCVFFPTKLDVLGVGTRIWGGMDIIFITGVGTG